MKQRYRNVCNGDARGALHPTAPLRGRGDVTSSLTEIAARLERLAPCHRDPEHFHEEKSELVLAIREVSRKIKGPSPGGAGTGDSRPEFRPVYKNTKGGRASD